MKTFLRLFSLLFLFTLPCQLTGQDTSTKAIWVDPDQPERIRPVRELEVKLWADKTTYRIGDSARVSFRVNRDARVVIFSTDPNGETRQIFPNYYDKNNYATGGRSYTVPRSGYSLKVLPPAGYETLTILATSKDRGFIGLPSPTQSRPFPKSSGVGEVQRRSGWGGGSQRDYARDTVRIRTVEDDDRPIDPYYGRVRVDTEPDGVQVWIGDTYYGTTPVNASHVLAGRQTMRLTKNGYIGLSRTIHVKAGDTVRFHERLQANPSGNLPWQGYDQSGGGYYWY